MSEKKIIWKHFYPTYLTIKSVESSASQFQIEMISETKANAEVVVPEAYRVDIY